MHYPVWLTRTLSILFGVGAMALLQGAVAMEWLSAYIVPTPVDMIATVPTLFRNEQLLEKFLLTFGITLSAASLSVIIGVPMGWALYRFPVLGQAYEPWLGAVFSAPLILLYPLFMVIIGRNVFTILTIAVIAGVVPITLNTLQALRSVPPIYKRVAVSLGMSDRQLATKVLLPCSLPAIFTGIRLGLIYAMIYVIGTEYLVNMGGLGFLINDLNSRYNIPGMYGAVLFVILTSILFFALVEKAEQWLKSR